MPVAPSGRYPRVPFGELLRSAPDLVLLPDEPYAFGPGEVAELDGHHLRARTIDGKALWWWGTRTPSAIAEVAELLAHG